MKIVSVCACTSGIAHTYIAKEKLIRAAESMGHTIKVETQGTIGTEDELSRCCNPCSRYCYYRNRKI